MSEGVFQVDAIVAKATTALLHREVRTNEFARPVECGSFLAVSLGFGQIVSSLQQTFTSRHSWGILPLDADTSLDGAVFQQQK
jgi:hypothetical protein